jgi:hypothetical protein
MQVSTVVTAGQCGDHAGALRRAVNGARDTWGCSPFARLNPCLEAAFGLLGPAWPLVAERRQCHTEAQVCQPQTAVRCVCVSKCACARRSSAELKRIRDALQSRAHAPVDRADENRPRCVKGFITRCGRRDIDHPARSPAREGPSALTPVDGPFQPHDSSVAVGPKPVAAGHNRRENASAWRQW